ncbi:hypothetical protein [Prescottella equi]|uniref:hypothetical protein n=1 Tax=Rhodococcus hoagii TaxID=43767 RepID=UPI000A11D6B4|nr:hypothetical protein [Prescottella equi]ORM04573.1 hypothetical protein A5N73_08025 [Prescottella equi]
MARTYPAKRSKVAQGFDFRGCTSTYGDHETCACSTWEPVTCEVCGEDIEDGQRVVETSRWIEHHDYADFETMHARCADAGEALP